MQRSGGMSVSGDLLRSGGLLQYQSEVVSLNIYNL